MALPNMRTFSTVDKFGVSIDQSQGQGPLIMPKVKYKWRVLFYGLGSPEDTADAITLNTNSLTLPTLTHETIRIHSYNSSAYYAGKHEWGTLSLVVRDTYDNTVALAVGRHAQRKLDHYQQTSFMSAADYKFKMVIQQLTGGHGSDGVTANYLLEGCFVETYDWGDLDYSSSEARTISMTIRPDNVIHEGPGIGGEYSIFANPGEDPRHNTINR